MVWQTILRLPKIIQIKFRISFSLVKGSITYEHCSSKIKYTWDAQSPPVWNAGAAVAGGIAAGAGAATSSAQFSAGTASVSTSLAQPGSAVVVASTGATNSLAGAISFAACSSFSA